MKVSFGFPGNNHVVANLHTGERHSTQAGGGKDFPGPLLAARSHRRTGKVVTQIVTQFFATGCQLVGWRVDRRHKKRTPSRIRAWGSCGPGGGGWGAGGAARSSPIELTTHRLASIHVHVRPIRSLASRPIAKIAITEVEATRICLIDEEPLSGAASSIQRLGRRELPGPLVAAPCPHLLTRESCHRLATQLFATGWQPQGLSGTIKAKSADKSTLPYPNPDSLGQPARSAKPFTPVQFRAWPPILRASLGPASRR